MGIIRHTTPATTSAETPEDKSHVRFNPAASLENGKANLYSEEAIDQHFLEARIWALLVTLPFEHFSTDAEYSQDFDDLREIWLGPEMDRATFHAILWNIAHRLLNEETGKPDYDSEDLHLSSDDAISLTNDEPPPELNLRYYRVKHPELFLDPVKLRTWAQIKAAARSSTASKVLHNDQLLYARQIMGLRTGKVDSDLLNTMNQQLKGKSCEEAEELAVHFNLGNKSTILVVTKPEPARKPQCGRTGARMDTRNVLTIYPLYFELKNDLITHILDSGPERNTEARPAILIHEMTHSQSSISTTDTRVAFFNFKPEEQQRDSQAISNGPWTEKGYYGLGSGLKLAAWDREHGTRFAQNNADNVSLLVNHYVLNMAYPEYNFAPGSGLKQGRLGITRKSLRHHSSLLDIFRHSELGLIRDLPGYDKHKDPFWSEESGWDRIPSTKPDLLAFLLRETDSQEIQRTNIQTRMALVNERKEAARQRAAEMEVQRKQAARQAAQRAILERQEAQRKDAERKQAEKEEAERTEALIHQGFEFPRRKKGKGKGKGIRN